MKTLEEHLGSDAIKAMLRRPQRTDNDHHYDTIQLSTVADPEGNYEGVWQWSGVRITAGRTTSIERTLLPTTQGIQAHLNSERVEHTVFPGDEPRLSVPANLNQGERFVLQLRFTLPDYSEGDNAEAFNLLSYGCGIDHFQYEIAGPGITDAQGYILRPGEILTLDVAQSPDRILVDQQPSQADLGYLITFKRGS